MPVDPLRTQVARYPGLRPGDIFFVRGKGLVGRLIRLGTGSPYAHCGVIVGMGLDGGGLVTHEAFGTRRLWSPGIKICRRDRSGAEFSAVYRMWGSAAEQNRIVGSSWKAYRQSAPYGWGEIALIVLAAFLPHRWIPSSDRGRGIICSHHVALCLDSMNHRGYRDFVRYPPFRMWPGGLAVDLNRWQWGNAPVFRRKGV